MPRPPASVAPAEVDDHRRGGRTGRRGRRRHRPGQRPRRAPAGPRVPGGRRRGRSAGRPAGTGSSGADGCVDGRVTAAGSPWPAAQASTSTSPIGRSTGESAPRSGRPSAGPGTARRGPGRSPGRPSAQPGRCDRPSRRRRSPCRSRSRGRGPAGWSTRSVSVTGSHARCRAGMVTSAWSMIGHRLSTAMPRSTSSSSSPPARGPRVRTGSGRVRRGGEDRVHAEGVSQLIGLGRLRGPPDLLERHHVGPKTRDRLQDPRLAVPPPGSEPPPDVPGHDTHPMIGHPVHLLVGTVGRPVRAFGRTRTREPFWSESRPC